MVPWLGLIFISILQRHTLWLWIPRGASTIQATLRSWFVISILIRKGVIGGVYILDVLSTFLKNIKLSPSSRVVIVDRSLLIIASSSGPVRKENPATLEQSRIKAQEHPDPIIQETGLFLEKQKPSSLRTNDTLYFTDSSMSFMLW